MEIISRIAEVYASAAGVIAVMWVLVARYRRRENVGKWQIAVWFVLRFLLAHVIFFPNIIQSLLGVLVTIFFSCIMLNGKYGEKILVVMIANIFMILVGVAETRITLLLTGVNQKMLIVQGNESLARIVGIVVDNTLYLFTAYIFVHYFKRKIRLKREEMLIVGVLYTLFFASSVLSIAALRYVNLLRIWQIAFLVLDALMLASNVAVLFLIDRLNQQNRYELENAMLRMQMIHQEERIRMEEKTYQEIRILRHDMKRYFVTYLQLMRDGQYELVERDMEQVLGKKLEKNYVMYTRNPILNAVITEKAKRCREKQIAFEVNAGEECEIEAMDIAIMLSNLVDNAIEAEQKEKPDAREIKLYIQITENMLHLIVQNYVSQSVLTHNPELSTTKGNSKMHGIGLVGVKSLVKQMGGEIEIGEEQDMFMVHVCINV